MYRYLQVKIMADEIVQYFQRANSNHMGGYKNVVNLSRWTSFELTRTTVNAVEQIDQNLFDFRFYCGSSKPTIEMLATHYQVIQDLFLSTSFHTTIINAFSDF